MKEFEILKKNHCIPSTILKNAPLEPFFCSILYRYTMKLLAEKCGVLIKTFLLTLKIVFLQDT